MKKGIVSGPKLGCCTSIRVENPKMIPSPNVNYKWSTESKGVIYNINSATPCCELNCSQMLSLKTPQGRCPSFCDPSAAGETLRQACHLAHWHQSVLHVAVWHITAGVALWPGGKRGSIAVAALALTLRAHQLITAHRGVMLTEGRGTPSEAHRLILWRWWYTPVEDYSLMDH